MAPRALVYIAPHKAEIHPVDDMPPSDSDGAREFVTVETAYSGVSRGTERLVFSGSLPESEWQRMRAPFQSGEFPFPVRYGYAAAGRVVAGPEALLGKRVFALHPHQTRFTVPASAVHVLPDAVPMRRAVLAANMETALNAIWDAELRPGERVLVMGAGLLGCLIAALASRSGDNPVVLSDIVEARAALARDFNVSFRVPDAIHGGEDGAFDVAFHTSAHAEGLQRSLDTLAFEGRVVELSWYGDRETTLRLGGAFHSRRLRIVSSQVGHVANSRRATTTHARRLAEAISLLDDPRLDALITGEVAFEDLPARLPEILAPGAPGIATAVRYANEES